DYYCSLYMGSGICVF
nr:immunoglobulin light chain junction region [Macaca mulatta]MOW15104.1 immunoglobulin light chain junction region [Macaca mulatta]MOW15230.1 immunoglobulin light chain junction region [Macaca mulatta]MOW15642.1 immunoglobulin light chain junction region [Macaca mulatta]MOW15715.1 immunoglobulin light chain junction region [Macaca mulatta]